MKYKCRSMHPKRSRTTRTLDMRDVNSKRPLHQRPFERSTLVDKLKVKELGPDQQDIHIAQKTREKVKAQLFNI